MDMIAYLRASRVDVVAVDAAAVQRVVWLISRHMIFSSLMQLETEIEIC